MDICYSFVNDTIKKHLVQYRRDFHRNPELGWLEVRTTEVIAKHLNELGYEVYVGVLYQKEIDFVVMKQAEKRYIQVANDISDPATFQREVTPLLQIRDAYPKMLIARTYQPRYQHEGIEIIDAADWIAGS